MRYPLLVLVLFSSVLARAADVAGSYYTPFSQINSTQYQPESLRILRADGTYEISTVHDGMRAVLTGTYKVEGNTLIVHRGKMLASCPNTVDADDSAEVTTLLFALTAEGLALTLPGDLDPVVIPAATPEQVKKVMALPICK